MTKEEYDRLIRAYGRAMAFGMAIQKLRKGRDVRGAIDLVCMCCGQKKPKSQFFSKHHGTLTMFTCKTCRNEH
jgi:hypothetical protein